MAYPFLFLQVVQHCCLSYTCYVQVLFAYCTVVQCTYTVAAMRAKGGDGCIINFAPPGRLKETNQ